MALDAELARIEAAALRARSVQDFLGLVERLRALTDDATADELRRLIRETPGATRGLGNVLRGAIVEAAAAARAAAVPAVARAARSAEVARVAMPAVVAATAPRERSALVRTVAAEARARAQRAADELDGRVQEDARRRAAELEARMRAAFSASSLLATSGAPVDVVRSPLLGAANSVRATLATEVTQTAGAYVTSISDEAGVATVWVAETNACVRCLAYSGVVTQPGETFPGGLTYGRRVRDVEPVAFPPLHPNCRCIVEPLGSQEYADALRREADRSVLRGFSLESESMATRVDAAQRLLERGVDAPASVIAYAERSVGAGRFATRDRPPGR